MSTPRSPRLRREGGEDGHREGCGYRAAESFDTFARPLHFMESLSIRAERTAHARLIAWALLAAVAVVWFGSLDLRHLLRSDEGRYAEIAREMLASGDWVTIRYNGLKYFEKPPLHLWMTALAFRLFGVGDWQARLWAATSGAIGIAFTLIAARRWFGPRVGLLAALVLLATPAWNLASHFNSLDIGVSAALAVVLAATLVAQHPSADAAERRRWMLVAWAGVAAAVLTKGLIGIVLPGLVLIAYSAVTRDIGLWKRLHLVSGMLLMLVITAPWFVLVSRRNPEFAQFFFIHEHLQRYTTSVHQRTAPLWYFVPQLVAGFVPWSALALPMFTAVRADTARGALRSLVLLAAWSVVIFVFFSASSSKLPGYIVPVYPALAILAAVVLDRLSARGWKRVLAGTAIFASVLAVAALLAPRFHDAPGFAGFAAWIAAGASIAALGMVLAWGLERKNLRLRSQAAACLALFFGTSVAFIGHETIGGPASGAALVPSIERVLAPGMPIYSVRLLDHTLPFYLRRTTIMVEGADELEFGVRQEPDKWIPTLQAFERAWTSGHRALAIMSPETYAQLAADHLPMSRVASDARRVVVANFPPPSP